MFAGAWRLARAGIPAGRCRAIRRGIPGIVAPLAWCGRALAAAALLSQAIGTGLAQDLAERAAPAHAWFVLPVVFYLPETSVAFALTGALHLERPGRKTSSIQPSVVYTLEQQVYAEVLVQLLDSAHTAVSGEAPGRVLPVRRLWDRAARTQGREAELHLAVRGGARRAPVGGVAGGMAGSQGARARRGAGHSLGLDARIELAGGEVPFTLLPRLGGAQGLRGYYEGRWRDRLLWMGQAEWRFPLAWRLRGTLFGGVAGVAPSIARLGETRPRAAGGLGLRVRVTSTGLNVRGDVAFGEEGPYAYLTIGEAF